jgi:hypothetical protein
LSVTGTPARPGAITGTVNACANTSEAYAVATVNGASLYTWSTTANGSVSAGQGTKNATVSWGAVANNQAVRVIASNSCGSSTTSALTGITISSCSRTGFGVNLELIAYPNPASELLNIQFNANQGDYNLQLIDATGRLVRSENGSRDGGQAIITIPVSDLSSGLYFVVVECGGSEETLRVSIN